MADPTPTKNPDGTTQVSPPTRSAFETEATPKKAGTPTAPTTSTSSASQKDTGDKEKTMTPAERDAIEGLKGLIRQGHSEMFNKNAQELDEHMDRLDTAKGAMDDAVKNAPGSTAYGGNAN